MKSANIITLIRIALVPVFMVVYLLKLPHHEVVALVLFLLASATDKLDGYIARKYNQISDFGKFIDPLADKLLITAALVMLSESGIIASWAVVLILSREFIVTGLRTVAMSAGRVIAANSWGKAKMVVQVIVVAFLLTPLRNVTIGITNLGEILIWLMTLVTVVSGIDYVYLNRDLFYTAK
ncbi:MAG: CDP-diacylglycerol--glycerol-3-phosphate 3-phosphatidyltransferase [Eubacteriales bacterium]|jgi:CDP-diacylglycerol--glycerol-3-phosphate 3-phosphatidyltransferase